MDLILMIALAAVLLLMSANIVPSSAGSGGLSGAPLKEKREKLGKLGVSIKEMADKINKPGEERSFTAEEQANWVQLNKDYDALEQQVTVAERAARVSGSLEEDREEDKERRRTTPGREDRDPREERDAEEERASGELTEEDFGVNEAVVDPRVVGLAMQGWMRRVSGYEVEERHVKAARKAGVHLGRPYFDIKLRKNQLSKAEARALSAVDLATGASTIAPSFSGAFEVAMLLFGGMREVAQVIRTETGAPMPWPTANDTGNKGRIVGENVAPTDVDVTTGAPSWGAYKYTSGFIKVPSELLEDSAFDLPSEVGRMCGERIGRRQNDDFTTGDAANKPKGISVAATLGLTAASATAITADEVLRLIHSVDVAYRTNARLMFHDNILLAIRLLKDGQNRYLFQGANDGQPSTIHGVPYTINNSMPSALTTAQRVMLFGQLDKYKIRDVRTIRLKRLVERFADTDQEGFVAFQRSDGNLLDAGVAPVRFLATA